MLVQRIRTKLKTQGKVNKFWHWKYKIVNSNFSYSYMEEENITNIFECQFNASELY